MSWKRPRLVDAIVAGALGVACACGSGSGGDASTERPMDARTARVVLDGLPGAEAVAFDSRGNLYAGSLGGTILRVTPSGDRTTLAETDRGIVGLELGPDDQLFATAIGEGEVLAVDPDGTLRVLADGLDAPNDLEFDARGTLFVSATGLAGHPQIGCVPPGGGFLTLTEQVSTPNGLAFGPDGRLYVAEILEDRIVRFEIDEEYRVSEPELYADALRLPDGIAFDDRGRLYAAGDDAIWIVEPGGGSGRRFVTEGAVDGPTSLAFARGPGRDPATLFFSNFGYPDRGSGDTIASVLLDARGQPRR